MRDPPLALEGERESWNPSDLEHEVQQGDATRTSQASISAALAAANAGANPLAPGVRFPGEDGGRSLAQMAQRDLDAALQLLADRAQYITGANGAAIALRRTGKNDMMCRASTGANVPELGALLSTEFGLSGESVRTRRALRCDDAERDPRVNREGCRELGIASVVVMPVVNDDEVLGVFELFSGKVNAFGERDLSALQRLSEMVETAVKLARAAENIPGQARTRDVPARVAASPAPAAAVPVSVELDDDILEVEGPVVEAEAISKPEPPAPAVEVAQAAPTITPAAPIVTPAPTPREEIKTPPAPVVAPALPKKPLFWSAASTAADVERPEPDQSHVPPVLRNLRTCEACGFPVSAGRALCVECEEKKWRGQLTVRKRSTPQPAVAPISAAPSTTAPAPVARAFAAVAPTSATVAVPAPVIAPKPVTAQILESPKAAPSPVADSKPAQETSAPNPAPVETPSPEFVLSAGLEPSQSWFSRNKYVIAVLLLVAAAAAAVYFLH